MNAKVSIRPGTPADHRFACDSFAREYCRTPHGRPLGERLAKALLVVMLRRWTLTVAAPSDGGDEIYAWILHCPDGIAWANVKPNYRGRGFFRALREHVAAPLVTPFLPAQGASRWSYRPALLIRELLDAARV